MSLWCCLTCSAKPPAHRQFCLHPDAAVFHLLSALKYKGALVEYLVQAQAARIDTFAEPEHPGFRNNLDLGGKLGLGAKGRVSPNLG